MSCIVSPFLPSSTDDRVYVFINNAIAHQHLRPLIVIICPFNIMNESRYPIYKVCNGFTKYVKGITYGTPLLTKSLLNNFQDVRNENPTNSILPIVYVVGSLLLS